MTCGHLPQFCLTAGVWNTKHFLLTKPNLFPTGFCLKCYTRTLCITQGRRDFLWLFKGFIALALSFRFMAHFKLIFVHGVRWGSKLLCQRVDIHLSWHHILNNYPFSTENCGTFATNHLIVNLWAYLWTFSPAPLTCVSALTQNTLLYCCSFIVSFTIGNGKFSNLVPWKNCFGYFVLYFPHTFMVRLLISGPLKSAYILIGVGCVCAQSHLSLLWPQGL